MNEFDYISDLKYFTFIFTLFRSQHELVALDETCIYAIGGNDGSSSLSTVEKYDHR